MHQGTAGTSGCKEKCVSFPFLSRAYGCGVCGTIKPNTAPIAPAPAPIRAPAPGPVPATAFNKACTPDSSILVFTGHAEAISMNKGTINVTWNPAFVYEIESDTLIWCGEYMYTVFVTTGEFNYMSTNITAREFYQIAQQSDSIDTYNTTKTSWIQSTFTPDSTYSILVMAWTQQGHSSFNREPALVEVASTDPKLNANFKRMVVIPEPSELFTVENKKDVQVVVFSGQLPSEVRGLASLDHMYFFDSDGNATLVQCTSKVIMDTGAIAWSYNPSDLGEVFDELDVSVDAVDRPIYENEDLVDLDPEEDAQLELELAGLDPNIKRHLCMVAYPGREPFDCSIVSNEDGRRLSFFGKLFKAIVKVIKKIAKAIVKVVVTILGAVATAIDFLVPIPEISASKTLLSIDDGGRVTCTSGQGSKLEVGVRFDASARARIKIKLSLATLAKRAAIDLVGGFGFTTYLSLSGAKEFKFEPDPIFLFKTSQHYVIPIGPVPVWITNRQSLSAFIEAVAVVESQALIKISHGYDYLLSYSFDRDRTPAFKSSSKLTKRKPPKDDPGFDLRLSAAAEVGVTLAWDTLLFDLLQATLAADLGLRGELAVGTNVEGQYAAREPWNQADKNSHSHSCSPCEAIVVTPPHFFTLDTFHIDLFVRVRLMLGLNNDLGKLIKKLTNPSAGGCKFSHGKFPIPKLAPSSSKNFDDAINKAKNNGALSTATSIAYSDFIGPDQDSYKGGLSKKLDGQQLDFGLNFILFSQDFRLFGIPEITIKEKSALFCTGSDAAIITYTTFLKKAPIDFLDDLSSGLWFANFDGAILQEEDTGWIMDKRTDINSFTVRLPRLASSRPGFSGYNTRKGANVILRATPELWPFPKNSMFAKAAIRNVALQCCESKDCVGANAGRVCVQNVCISAPTKTPKAPTKAPVAAKPPTKAPIVNKPPTKAPFFDIPKV
jgi:hypothetical protein